MALPVRTQNSVGPVPPSCGLAKAGLPDEATVTMQTSALSTVSKPMRTMPAVGTDRLLSRSWRRNNS